MGQCHLQCGRASGNFSATFAIDSAAIPHGSRPDSIKEFCMISKRKSTIALAGIALAAMFSIATPVQAQDAPKVKLATSMGDIVVQLDPAKPPKTVENFLTYV